MMRQLAVSLRERRLAAELRWLDYGCGKGGFIEEISPLGLFSTITGYDPVVAAFQVRPQGRYDLVTCLHVLDVVETNFFDAVLADIAAFTGGIAVFDVLILPKPIDGLRPHKPFYWAEIVRRQMDVVEARVESPACRISNAC
jgi:2-polyprenyl-3-methyl-5-hydroxy-6-metoxy-1,4-benzoquinol methylase